MKDSSKWGPWTFNPDNLTLEIHDELGRMRYYADLERCTTSAEVLDWIIQISTKSWASNEILAGFVREVDRLLDLQARLCGQGVEKGPINVAEVLKISQSA